MKPEFTDGERRLLEYAGVQSTNAAGASGLLPRLRKLVRIIERQGNMLHALSPKGELGKATLSREGLAEVLESIIVSQAKRLGYIRDELARRCIILLEIQARELRIRREEFDREENARLDREYQGAHKEAFAAVLFRAAAFIARGKSREAYAQAAAEMEAKKLDKQEAWRRQAAAEKATEDAEVSRSWKERQRNRPARCQTVSWLQPMSQGDYVRGTGLHRKRVERQLQSIGAEPFDRDTPAGRGRPGALYSTAMNLRVLDWWLGTLDGAEALEAIAAFLKGQPPEGRRQDISKLGRILRAHAKRAAGKVSAADWQNIAKELSHTPDPKPPADPFIALLGPP